MKATFNSFDSRRPACDDVPASRALLRAMWRAVEAPHMLVTRRLSLIRFGGRFDLCQ